MFESLMVSGKHPTSARSRVQIPVVFLWLISAWAIVKNTSVMLFKNFGPALGFLVFQKKMYQLSLITMFQVKEDFIAELLISRQTRVYVLFSLQS